MDALDTVQEVAQAQLDCLGQGDQAPAIDGVATTLELLLICLKYIKTSTGPIDTISLEKDFQAVLQA
jgi:hypothetical protein